MTKRRWAASLIAIGAALSLSSNAEQATPESAPTATPYRYLENTGAVTLDTAEGPTTTFRIPTDAKPGDTIHIIAEATDDGKLSLTRYARAVVTVK